MLNLGSNTDSFQGIISNVKFYYGHYYTSPSDLQGLTCSATQKYYSNTCQDCSMCESCTQTNQEYCFSCNKASYKYPLYSEHSCIGKCSNGTYLSGWICIAANYAIECASTDCLDVTLGTCYTKPFGYCTNCTNGGSVCTQCKKGRYFSAEKDSCDSKCSEDQCHSQGSYFCMFSSIEGCSVCGDINIGSNVPCYECITGQFLSLD
eukprot:TRINITY_DN3849_c0_g1_i1.p3 TRINITY_DN3849_c0_g1~~TRINITY_DN3849_c0_g1_i1.p3  ORF type:complete len:206 (+),score=26.48 TRINITY_DN3849_c0_g1_i1:375-992(+)